LTDILNVTSWFNAFNLTDLINYNVSSLIDSLNLTGLINYNVTSLIDDLNLTSLIAGLNLTSLLDNINWTSIFSGNNTADTGAADKDKGTESNWWDSIFGKKDSGSGSIIDNIINWITGGDKNNAPATPANNAATNKVTKKATKITASKKTFKAKKSKKYTITLKSGKTPLKKVKVTIKVGKKTYTAKTNSKGKATFNLKKLTKKGKYTATIKFAGNKNYKATTKKVKITVKK
jgi:hypothetical protein